MDKHSLTAKNSMGHILRGIPKDDVALAKHREALEAAVEACKEILKLCQDEAHRALTAIVPKEVACSCARCRANAYIEVIQALPYDELLELIMYGNCEEGEEPTDCAKPAETATARPSGGAGDSHVNTLSLSEC